MYDNDKHYQLIVAQAIYVHCLAKENTFSQAFQFTAVREL